ncbi:MAG TPA: DUF3592 domain-containing protein [Acidimicrobiales bacterium]|nr:DUF3592 domain-containing protein [Acidimicrobiales bacterium]
MAGGPGQQGRGSAAAGLVVSVVLLLAGIGGAAVAALDALHAEQSGASPRNYLILAAVAVVAVVFFIRCTMHAEHRLRAADALAAGYAPAAPSFLTTLAVGSRAGRRYSPVSASAAIVLFLVVLAISVVSTVAEERDASRSAFTQSNGIPVEATVSSVDDIWHSERYGSGYYTSEIYVVLQRPVDGTRSSTVYYPGQYSGGSTMPVVVDPDDPSYSEVPGSPSTARSTWYGLLGLDVVILALLVCSIVARLAQGRHRRGFLAQSSSSGAGAGAGFAAGAAPGDAYPGAAGYATTSSPLVPDASATPSSFGSAPSGDFAATGDVMAGTPGGTSGAANGTGVPGAYAGAGFPASSASPGYQAGVDAPAGAGVAVGATAGLAGAAANGPFAAPQPEPAPPVHPPAWHPDPFGRFKMRYWDGSEWTQWVSDGGGATATDPLTPSP